MEVNKIIQGDSLEVLKTLPDESVDIIFTSPPYNKAGYEGFIRKPHRQDTWGRRNISYGGLAEKDFMPEEEYRNWQVEVLNELWRVLKPKGSCFYNHKVRVAQHRASHPIEWILKSKFVFRQQLVWDRDSTPTVAPIRFLPTTELVFWLTKTATQPDFKRIDSTKEVLRIKPARSKHPAPFPEGLVRLIIKHCGGKVVLDPFMGSGTTAVVAKELGKEYIGIELNPEYIKIAEKRLQQQTLL